MTAVTAISDAAVPAQAPSQPAFGLRLACGLIGLMVAAMVSGLNGRVPGLALADVQAGLGFSRDQASWLTTAFAAGELAAMPFATWFAITFSLRRFHLTMLGLALALALLMPLVRGLELMLVLRGLQGLFSGALIPVLMMSALRFLPPTLRLHGLAIYALTATFSPNVALWVAAVSVDHLQDWRWLYWQAAPVGLAAMGLVAWGMPEIPPVLSRLKHANWLGLMLGVPGLVLLVLGVDQGVRLDWFASPLVAAALVAGGALTGLFLVTEWYHAAPFMQLRLLGRRNLGLGFLIFCCLVITLSTAVGLPASILAQTQHFRLQQTAMIGLIVGLPQLVLGPLVALCLYQKRIDARYVFIAGLGLIAAACGLSSGLTGEWMAGEFILPSILQAFGQPMAIVSLLFLATSVVQPLEGASVSGMVNTLRALATLLGSAIISHLMAARGAFHRTMMLDHATAVQPGTTLDPATLGQTASLQATVLAAADIYRIFGLLALCLIPLVLALQFIPAPGSASPAPASR